MMTSPNDDQGVDGAGAAGGEVRPGNRARVARLRREIAAGTYAADPDAVATALLAAGALTPGDAD